MPNTHVRFNIEQFDFSELIGAIKAKVLELGGRVRTPTTLDLAEQHRNEANYQKARKQFKLGSDGFDLSVASVREMIETFEKQATQIINRKLIEGLRVSRGIYGVGTSTSQFTMMAEFVGSGPGAEHSELNVAEFRGNVPLPGEAPFMVFKAPTRLKTTTYKPDIDRTGGVVWQSSNQAYSPTELAKLLLGNFIELSGNALKNSR